MSKMSSFAQTRRVLVDDFDELSQEALDSIQQLEEEHSRANSSQEDEFPQQVLDSIEKLEEDYSRSSDSADDVDFTQFVAKNMTQIVKMEPKIRFSEPLTVPSPPKFSPITSNKLDLKFWGLPDSIIDVYADMDITQLFPWQTACLDQPEITIDGKNLLYNAPCSGGKSLVADILMIKRVLDTRRRVLYVVPYVSIVTEKAKNLPYFCKLKMLSFQTIVKAMEAFLVKN